MVRDWTKLHRLLECGEETRAVERLLAELEKEWEAGRDESARDNFFARSFPSIAEIVQEDLDDGRWWPRLCDYFDERQDFRENFRPPMYRRSDRQELKRFKAVFDVWNFCVSDEGREGSFGRLYESYRLELGARLASTWSERQSLFAEAAAECLRVPLSMSDSWSRVLHRRGLILESHASRIAAFACLNTNPADLQPVEESFREALDRALKAQEVWYEAEDTHPNYLGFWAEAIGLRRAEVDRDFVAAREAHRVAREHLAAFADPGSLFKEPGLWWSVADFHREERIIGVLEALKEGPGGLGQAVKLLQEWVADSQTELAGTLRLTRMEIRLRALEILAESHEGSDVRKRVPGLFEDLGKYPAIGRNTWEIANQLELAVRGRAEMSSVLECVGRMFPHDAHGPIGAASIPKIRWDLLPRWYEATYERARQQGENEAGVLVLLWYARTVADYTWDVYVKNLGEEGGPDPGAPPDLMLATCEQIREVLEGLVRALCWSGYPGRALETMVQLIGEAVGALVEDIAGEILPAIIEETASTLYPLPLRIEGRDSSSLETLVATRFSGVDQTLRLQPVPGDPDKGTYVYIKPRFKQSHGLLKQDSALTLYPARAFGEPRPVLVICEGVSDQAVLEVVLSDVDAFWRALEIRLIPAGGDGVPDRYVAFKEERPVVIADADKRYGLAGGPWNTLWEMCCYGFVLDPDLERLHMAALSVALSAHWGCEVRISELTTISETCKTGKQFERQVCRYYMQSGFKSRAFGLVLGQALVRAGVPQALKEVVVHVLQLANGRRLACRKDTATPFHHCIVSVP